VVVTPVAVELEDVVTVVAFEVVAEVEADEVALVATEDVDEAVVTVAVLDGVVPAVSP
jgi:hypothetical protein